MFNFTSVFPWSKTSPTVIDLPAELSGYHSDTDSLHSEAVITVQIEIVASCHRFSSGFHPRDRTQGQTPTVGLDTPVSPRVKFKPEPLSQIPLKFTAPASASHAEPLSRMQSVLLDGLREEVSALLSQCLPEKDPNELLQPILALAKGKLEYVQQLVPIRRTIRSETAPPNPPQPSTRSSSASQKSPITTIEQGFGSLEIKTITKYSALNSQKAHFDTTKADTKQVWLYNVTKWEDISDLWNKERMVVHPMIADRVLTIREDKTPNWILKKSAEAKAKDKAKGKQRSTESVAP
ncbi:hypothetical protein B0H17DRAFT_1145898 [Mycena rosella]|uniref:Uncharacterized protein n=1 Tax=Mycena rosella TaxID=1033263 RepID=A0AAD7G1C2_MYCRO|nr:hypothetical protein B0H17DRAFT_1145898 [Mycena rosella]